VRSVRAGQDLATCRSRRVCQENQFAISLIAKRFGGRSASLIEATIAELARKT
jgi:hypothetical protein